MSVGDNVAYWIESGIGVKFQSRHVEQGKVIALDGDHLQIQPGSSGRIKVRFTMLGYIQLTPVQVKDLLLGLPRRG